MQRDDYIESFFQNIKLQLDEAMIAKDSRSARYKNLVVAAQWSNELWEIQLNPGNGEQIARQYDPVNARSSQGAADYFVDALRRTMGEEALPRPAGAVRYYRKRPGN